MILKIWAICLSINTEIQRQMDSLMIKEKLFCLYGHGSILLEIFGVQMDYLLFWNF